MQQSAQTSQAQVSQQEELIKQLQSKLNSTESQVIDIAYFELKPQKYKRR
jgi:hypothetical protein